jgi:hypothetical protein
MEITRFAVRTWRRAASTAGREEGFRFLTLGVWQPSSNGSEWPLRLCERCSASRAPLGASIQGDARIQQPWTCGCGRVSALKRSASTPGRERGLCCARGRVRGRHPRRRRHHRR